MTLETWRNAFFTVLVVLVIGIIVAMNQGSEVGKERVASSEQVEDLEDEIAQLEEELEDTEDVLREVRKKYRATRADVVTDEEAEQFAVEGLSGDGTDFDCLDFKCLQIRATIQFMNDTDEGSPVSCVIEVEHTNGKTTHTTFASPYVPPNGEDFQKWFYYSPLSGTEIDTYYIRECRRSEESSSLGGD